MNFIRSLTLTLLVNSGVKIAGAWHDLTGFAVLAVTAALLIGLALWLERRAKSPAGVPSGLRSEAGGDVSATSGRKSGKVVTRVGLLPPRLLASGLALASALVVFFCVNTRPALHRDAPVPDLAAMLPLAPAGWQVDTANDLYQFSGILHTDHLAQRTYTRLTEQGPVQIILYLAYWRAGQASVSLVSSHTPDACWPGAGWQPIAIPQPRVALTVGPRRLPEAEARSFVSGDFPQNVWYWHLFDGRPLTQQSTDSPAKLLRLAWRYGFRRDGDQLFVRVSSNRSWTEIAREPVVESFFTRLQPLGL